MGYYCKGLYLQEHFSQACLYCKFTNAHCSDKEDVQTFLNDICTKKVELSVGIVISNDNYQNFII